MNSKAIGYILVIALFILIVSSTAAEAKFVTINGRSAVGYFVSDKGGVYDSATFRVPDGKFSFKFDLPGDVKGVYRLTFGNNTFPGNAMDYLYFDVPLSFMGLDSVKARIGQFKNKVSKESAYDNLVGHAATNNSVGIFSSIDRGIQLSGKREISNYMINWALALTEGSNTTGTATADADGNKAVTVNLGTKLTDAFSLSGYYYNSGDLGTSAAAARVAGLRNAGTSGLKDWDRTLLLIRGDYAFDGGILSASFGKFDDDTSTTGGIAESVEGKTWMVEGRYDVTEKVYLAGMFSKLDIDGNYTMAASGGYAGMAVAVNEMKRTELAIAYRLAKNIRLKYSYTDNNRKFTPGQIAAGVTDPDDDASAFYMTVKW